MILLLWCVWEKHLGFGYVFDLPHPFSTPPSKIDARKTLWNQEIIYFKKMRQEIIGLLCLGLYGIFICDPFTFIVETDARVAPKVWQWMFLEWVVKVNCVEMYKTSKSLIEQIQHFMWLESGLHVNYLLKSLWVSVSLFVFTWIYINKIFV